VRVDSVIRAAEAALTGIVAWALVGCSSTNAGAPATDASTSTDSPAEGARPEAGGHDGGPVDDSSTLSDGGPVDGAPTDASDAADAEVRTVGAMACSDGGPPAPIVIATPFASPNAQLTLTLPTIPCATFKITDYGAVSGGAVKNTNAFAQAVAAATAAGGGVVDVPPGNWLTGPIHLASSIELHLEDGATVLFSTDFVDYGYSDPDGGTASTVPLVPTRWEGLDIMNGSPLVYCLNCTNVAITGTGTLYGQGAAWWGWKSTSAVEDQRMYSAILSQLGLIDDAGAPSDAGRPASAGPLTLPVSGVTKGLRPTMVECNGCTNFLIQDVTIKDGPYWIVHPLYSESVVVRGAHILSGKEAPLDGGAAASNGDGFDPDSCKGVLLEDTDFDTSDDNIAVKSGLNEDGIFVNRPSEEIVIRRVTSIAGHGGMTIGSEMSGGIHDVYATDSMLTGTGIQFPLRYKTLPGRGGTITDIFYDGIVLDNWTQGGIIIDMAYGSSTLAPFNPALLPRITNISFSNISGPANTAGTGLCPPLPDAGADAAVPACPPITFRGQARSPLQNVTLDNVTLAGPGSTCSGGSNAVQLTNVNVPMVPMNGPWSCP
jgi:polygalacturonase